MKEWRVYTNSFQLFLQNVLHWTKYCAQVGWENGSSLPPPPSLFASHMVCCLFFPIVRKTSLSSADKMEQKSIHTGKNKNTWKRKWWHFSPHACRLNVDRFAHMNPEWVLDVFSSSECFSCFPELWLCHPMLLQKLWLPAGLWHRFECMIAPVSSGVLGFNMKKKILNMIIHVN